MSAACLLATALGLALGLLSPPPSAAAAAEIQEYPLANEHRWPTDITTGPDGNLWFTETGRTEPNEHIARITPSGQVSEFDIPNGDAWAEPNGIAAGPDGRLWYTETFWMSNRISALTTAGVFTRYSPLLSGYVRPWEVAAGPDGAVWFTESHSNYGSRVGRITTDGKVTEFCLRPPCGVDDTPPPLGPRGIAAGPDGNIWVALRQASSIARITPSGVITEFPLAMGSEPFDIATGGDGNLWFTETGTNKIGRISPSGEIEEFLVPPEDARFPDERKYLYGICAGPDGNVWFMEQIGKIGRITPEGIITEFDVPAGPESIPNRCTAGPDDALWFTESGASRIGRIAMDGPLPEPETEPEPGRLKLHEVSLQRGRILASGEVNSGVGRVQATARMVRTLAGRRPRRQVRVASSAEVHSGSFGPLDLLACRAGRWRVTARFSGTEQVTADSAGWPELVRVSRRQARRC